MFEHLTIGKLISIKSCLREQWQDTGSLSQADYVRFAMAVLELEARLVKSPTSLGEVQEPHGRVRTAPIVMFLLMKVGPGFPLFDHIKWAHPNIWGIVPA